MTMPRKIHYLLTIVVLWFSFHGATAQQHISIQDPQNWTVADLTPYIGQTVIFDVPMYICSAPSTIYIGPRRLFTPTNQVLPGSLEYRNLLTLNNNGSIRLDNYEASYPEAQVRTGVKVYNLKAKVYADHLEMLDGEWRDNLRKDLEAEVPDVDMVGEHTLLICGMNLEYYLNQQYDPSSSMGPDNNTEHQAQRAKVSKALAKINADIYGLVEIQQGDSAIKEVAHDLMANTGRTFRIISDGTSANGTYTKSGFIYCPDKVKPYGMLQEVRVGVKLRKYMQIFEELATGERFIYSINHFKAKSGSGASGADANRGDGQGAFNASRVAEANGVIDKYNTIRAALKDDDILVMGDLNAYAKEDPITTFLKNGFYDLHRYFHADSSYSYMFGGTAGYLDHAITSASLVGQVTGMAAYNINSDENDKYTYDKSSDRTMFRCSDHDPVLVGLRLDSTALPDTTISIANWGIDYDNGRIFIRHALDLDAPAYYRIHTISGFLVEQGQIVAEDQEIARPQQKGLFIINIYTKKNTYQFKIINP